MDLKKFRTYETIITLLIGLLIGLTAIAKLNILSIVVLIAGIMLLYFLKKKLKVEDERIYKISEQASKRTLQIFGAGIAICGFLLMSIYKQNTMGFVLVYAAFILWVIYLIFYDYYRKKYGE